MASKRRVSCLLPITVMLLLCVALRAQVTPAEPASPSAATAQQVATQPLVISVKDETGKAVPQARVSVIVPGTNITLQRETDFRGHLRLPLVAGVYNLEVEKDGFYAARIPEVQVGGDSSIEVTLTHVQEFHETVEVTDSVRGVDLAQTAAEQKLTNREIFSLPYPTTRDYRQVLVFIPGIVQDNQGQMHVAGAASNQLLQHLDGFNITHPVTGAIEMRMSPDSLRLIDIQQSRYSAQYGKGAGGVMQLESGMGDDHFRFSATNFVPGFEIDRGIHFETVTPRITLSGPIKKGRAWWFWGLDGEYDFNFIRELNNTPENQSPAWRVDSLNKFQVNLTPGNILTLSALVNYAKATRVGLSLFTPPESTTDQRRSSLFFSLRDALTLPNQALLETGFAFSQFSHDAFPRGDSPYTIAPSGTSGSFFEALVGRSRRFQSFMNFYLPARQWKGKHEFRLGLDANRILYRQQIQRDPISIVVGDGSLQRQVTFSGPPIFSQDNVELSAYAQDRWSPSERMLIEYGLRLDWDDIIRDVLVGPRLASTYWLSPAHKTKLSAGIGLVYDVTSLDLLTRPLQGARFDQIFGPGETPIGPPQVTMFVADPRELKAASYLNWSMGLEQMLPGSVYMQLDFIQRRGTHGLTYVNQGPAAMVGTTGIFLLSSTENHTYDAFHISATKQFAATHKVFFSYTHSAARSNAVIDFNLNNPIFAQQSGGALPWDVPNRIISWGWLPMGKKFDFAYSLDWRTGFPFSIVNQQQQLVGLPNRLRFPDYFALNVHVEHRFRFRGHEWALRVGFNNITGHDNPGGIVNNIDSPDFLTFFGTQRRTFTGRIRLLAKK